MPDWTANSAFLYNVLHEYLSFDLNNLITSYYVNLGFST